MSEQKVPRAARSARRKRAAHSALMRERDGARERRC